MKRTLSILLAVMMLLSVAACNNTPASPKLTRGTWNGRRIQPTIWPYPLHDS